MDLFKRKQNKNTSYSVTKDVVVLAYDDKVLMGQELVVEENQLGIAMFNDKFCDILQPGVYNLSPSNLSLLCSAQRGKKKDKDNKVAKHIEGDIYIVSKEKITFEDLTSFNFVVRDKKCGRVEGKARFSVVVKIADPLKFLKGLRVLVSLVSSGKAKRLTGEILKDVIAEIIQKENYSVSDITTNNNVELRILQKLVEKMKFMGLDVINFNMLGFILPNKLKKIFGNSVENSKPSVELPKTSFVPSEMTFQRVGKQGDGDREISVTLIKSNEKSSSSAILNVDNSSEKKGLDINFNQLLGKGEFEDQVIICPNCGKVMKKGDKFCSACAYCLDNNNE